ncbi:MAG: sulfatase [Candidatus Poribacteria bacterium]
MSLNIIYIHSHDTGKYTQPYGHAIPTPNIQKLAEEGVLFRQAFCANPTCSPSRASLLTGQWAHSCGMGGLANRGWSLPFPGHLIMHTLKQAGYVTAMAGFQHVVKDVSTAGYTRVLSQEKGKAGAEEHAVAFLSEKHDQPFFLDVGFGETHRRGAGFDNQPAGEEKTDPRYVKPPAPFLDTPDTRQDMAEYIDAARTLDYKMGQVFEAVDRNGLTDNTMIICTTDHGLAFPNMKCHLTDHGIGVMLIVRGPNDFKGGKVIDGMVSQVDLFPTICELIDIENPSWLQGTSIVPLIHGEEEIRQEIFAEVNYHCCYEPQRAVRTKRWKYIRRYDQATTLAMPNCDEGISKTYMIEHNWHQKPVESERLYDLVYDPGETNNLAYDNQHQETLEEMRHKLDLWRQETEDPLWENSIMMPPETAVLNDPNDLSPNDKQYPAWDMMGIESS